MDVSIRRIRQKYNVGREYNDRIPLGYGQVNGKFMLRRREPTLFSFPQHELPIHPP